MNAYQNKNISSFQLQTGWYLFTERKNLVHFYKKFQDIIILFHDFSLLFMTFHGLTKFRDFSSRSGHSC